MAYEYRVPDSLYRSLVVGWAPDITFRERGRGNAGIFNKMAAVSLDSIGAEPLKGSGFETVELELKFSSAGLSGEN